MCSTHQGTAHLSVGSLLLKGNSPCIFQAELEGKGNSPYGSGSPCPQEPLRAHTPVCHLWVFPCSQVGVQLAWKIFPCVFWKACSGKLAPALAPPSDLLGVLPLLSFRVGVLLTMRSLKEPTVLPAGSSAWLPTMSPEMFASELLKGCPPQQGPLQLSGDRGVPV